MTVMLLGQSTWTQLLGGQRTVTVNVQQTTFVARSNAQHVTVVVPTAKVEPEAGVHVIRSRAQLSVAVGGAYWTAMALQLALTTSRFVGQEMDGGIVSRMTVTWKQQKFVNPAKTLVQHTVRAPRAKLLPEGGTHTTGRAVPAQTLVA